MRMEFPTPLSFAMGSEYCSHIPTRMTLSAEDSVVEIAKYPVSASQLAKLVPMKNEIDCFAMNQVRKTRMGIWIDENLMQKT